MLGSGSDNVQGLSYTNKICWSSFVKKTCWFQGHNSVGPIRVNSGTPADAIETHYQLASSQVTPIVTLSIRLIQLVVQFCTKRDTLPFRVIPSPPQPKIASRPSWQHKVTLLKIITRMLSTRKGQCNNPRASSVRTPSNQLSSHLGDWTSIRPGRHQTYLWLTRVVWWHQQQQILTSWRTLPTKTTTRFRTRTDTHRAARIPRWWICLHTKPTRPLPSKRHQSTRTACSRLMIVQLMLNQFTLRTPSSTNR